jgi:hypothetical protein
MAYRRRDSDLIGKDADNGMGRGGDYGKAADDMSEFVAGLACVASAVAASADAWWASLPLLLVVATAQGGRLAAAAAFVAVGHIALVAAMSDGAPVDLVASTCGALAGVVLTPNKALCGLTVIWASVTAAVVFAALAANASPVWAAVPTGACVVAYGVSFFVKCPRSVVGPPGETASAKIDPEQQAGGTTGMFLY